MGSTLKVVERSQLEQVLAEQKLGYSGLVKLDSAKKLGELLGADTIVLGSLRDLGETVDVNARLVALESGTGVSAAQARIAKTQVVGQQLGQVAAQAAVGAGLTLGTGNAQSSSEPKFYLTEKKTLKMQVVGTRQDKKKLIVDVLFEYLEPIMGPVAFLKVSEKDRSSYVSDKEGARHFLAGVEGLAKNDWLDVPLKIPTKANYVFELEKPITGPVDIVVALEGQTNNEFQRVTEFNAIVRDISVPYLYKPE
jgi:hypothetical protein